MKFGFRTPSLKKKLSSTLSVKKALRNATGLKMPKGIGMLTNPKKAIYNKIYNKTTRSAGCLVLILIILFFIIGINSLFIIKHDLIKQYITAKCR